MKKLMLTAFFLSMGSLSAMGAAEKNSLIQIRQTVEIHNTGISNSEREVEVREPRCSIKRIQTGTMVLVGNQPIYIPMSLRNRDRSAFSALVRAISSGACRSTHFNCEYKTTSMQPFEGLGENNLGASPLAYKTDEAYRYAELDLNGVVIESVPSSHLEYSRDGKLELIGIPNPEAEMSRRLAKLYELGVCW